VNLTLEIISPNGQSLGSARRKVFGPEGGRIGRAPDCEWVLANPYVSRHHATVRWISGTYYIESTGENGVAVNTPQAQIPPRERRALKSGDRLFVDEYEIMVAVGGAVNDSAASGAGGLTGFSPLGDPLGDLAATARSPVLTDPLEPSRDELDPLKQLSAGAPGRAPPAQQPDANWNHTPGVLDQFTPPEIPAGAIPDDWNRTSFGRGRDAAAGAGRPTVVVSDPLTPAQGSGASDAGFAPIPDDWDKTSFSRSGVLTAPTGQSAPPPSARVPGAMTSAPVSRLRAEPLPLRPAPVVQGQGGLAQKNPPAPPSPTQQAPAPPVSAQLSPASQPADQQPGSPAAGNLDLTDLLRAAGVDPATIPPETARSLGLILRTVVQGVVEVLQARAEIKDQFRLALTRIKTAENNPLKFAVNAEDALNSLLGRRNPAYLAPVEAFEDAFDDIRFHQMAMLAGMRAGFEHAVKRFDPERLQEVFDKRVKRGGFLQMSMKSRYWDFYAAEFRELTADPEDAFKRLFGEVFGGAYEQQLEELKRSRRKPPR
jgi:type VI secretion system FHA domain protein